ncbi:hypothetical protein BJ508DRAFT_170436 [Ascobolus immersus RN42]|uniref:Uncharacterized protein n=1 Tax=Ascobolus immersus RN42 TaxID=1160509 RepID=A0A3N4HUI2_ASCIM|nr:hypothetical protein BJ508DRAFT_170436 [Ascobolus immersus RN42]
MSESGSKNTNFAFTGSLFEADPEQEIVLDEFDIFCGLNLPMDATPTFDTSTLTEYTFPSPDCFQTSSPVFSDSNWNNTPGVISASACAIHTQSLQVSDSNTFLPQQRTNSLFLYSSSFFQPAANSLPLYHSNNHSCPYSLSQTSTNEPEADHIWNLSHLNPEAATSAVYVVSNSFRQDADSSSASSSQEHSPLPEPPVIEVCLLPTKASRNQALQRKRGPNVELAAQPSASKRNKNRQRQEKEDTILKRVQPPAAVHYEDPRPMAKCIGVMKEGRKPPVGKKLNQAEREKKDRMRKRGACYVCKFRKTSCEDVEGPCGSCTNLFNKYWKCGTLDLLNLACVRMSLHEMRFRNPCDVVNFSSPYDRKSSALFDDVFMKSILNGFRFCGEDNNSPLDLLEGFFIDRQRFEEHFGRYEKLILAYLDPGYVAFHKELLSSPTFHDLFFITRRHAKLTKPQIQRNRKSVNFQPSNASCFFKE